MLTSKLNLIIVGAGGLGLEIQTWFEDALESTSMTLRGFLDDHAGNGASGPGHIPVLGSIDSYAIQENDRFVCAIGDPATRLNVAARLQAKGAQFATLVHPDARIAKNSRLDEGCVVFPFAIVDAESSIGPHSLLYFRAGVGHHVKLGGGCTVLTNAVVGSRCVLETGAIISIQGFCNSGISVGEFATVGGNSFAVRDLPSRTTALGVPARHLNGGGAHF